MVQQAAGDDGWADGMSAPAPARPAGMRAHVSRLALTGPARPAAAGSRFAWLVTLSSTWIMVGLYLDGWFHIHRDGESFFTPWHGVLYSGVAVAVAVHVVDQRRAGGVRPGYGPSLAGLLVVGAAGFVDMVWHTVFGVEDSLDALLSPPHLLLITAGTLGVAGPLRAALLADRRAGGGLPSAFSAAFVVTGLAFFSQYANPIAHLYPAAGWDDATGRVVSPPPSLAEGVVELRQVAGIAGVVLLAAMLGAAVAVLRRGTVLVPGALFVVVAVPAAFLTTLRMTLFLLPGVLIAAVLTELLGRHLRPAPLGALAASLLTTAWVASIAAAHDLAWSVDLLTGSVGSAAAAGYLAGWLVEAGSRSQSSALAHR